MGPAGSLLTCFYANTQMGIEILSAYLHVAIYKFVKISVQAASTDKTPKYFMGLNPYMSPQGV